MIRLDRVGAGSPGKQFADARREYGLAFGLMAVAIYAREGTALPKDSTAPEAVIFSTQKTKIEDGRSGRLEKCYGLMLFRMPRFPNLPPHAKDWPSRRD